MDEVDSLSQEIENIFDVEKIFDIYRFYSDRSLELINHQKEIISNIFNSNDLNTIDFVDKSREDKKRFASLDEIKKIKL